MTESNLYQSPDADVVNINSDTCETMALFSMKQRIGRIRYLAYSMGVYLLLMLASLVLFGIGAAANISLGDGSIASFLLLGILYLLTLFGFVVVGIRRLHDVNKSGLYYFLMIVPLVNFIFSLYLVFARGSEGANEYGPAPLPNNAGTWIAGLILPVIFVVGVLAAIALPAYQSYVDQASQGQYMQD